MLSYQHHYHAGNLADVHKHALLAQALAYLTQKDKPLTYLETHSGRGVYDLASDAARKTGEAAQGIEAVQRWFAKDDPYLKALAATREVYGPQAYPGSPAIAQALLRPMDKLHLAELHPGEYLELINAVWGDTIKTYQQDGLQMALSLCPPDPRRGLLLIDPSWEVKTDYQTIPRVMGQLAAKWNVGVLMLWYPVLTDGVHQPMLRALTDAHPQALRHEVRFPPARQGHRMIGSGMFVINPPWGLDTRAAQLGRDFAKLAARR